MAAPSEAFPLASRPSGLPRVTPFLVKVTDSGLKSLQDALQSKSPTGASSSIAFRSSEGQIVFGANARPFKFTVSDMQQDMGAKGPLEAAEQFVSDGQWYKLGLMRYRATIMATDDSYQSTKRKALEAEQEAKKASAKVLKQPKATVGASKASAKIWKKVNDAATAMTRCQRMPVGAAVSSESKATSSIRSSSQKAPTANQRGLNVTKKTLRERVIHHLLIRPCSPKELLTRLVKEGLSADERQNFQSIFDAVAQVKNQSSSNGASVYELKQQCLSEVSDEWPFYSSWDRQVAKRALAARLSLASKRESASVPLEMVPKKEESKKSRPVAGSTGSLKAKQTQGARSILDDLLPSDNGYAAPAPKQQKISTQPPEKAPSSTLAKKDPRPAGEPPPPAPPPLAQEKPKIPVNSGIATKSSNGYESGKRKRPRNTDFDRSSPHHVPSATPTESQSCSSNSICSDRKASVQVPSRTPPSNAALLEEYPDIDTLEERQKYKELFDRDYPKYLSCYGKLSAIAGEFFELGEKLREADRGSAEYAAIEREICDRYKRFREDPISNCLRKQHDTIRAKLAAIKSRVASFDRRHQVEVEDDDSD